MNKKVIKILFIMFFTIGLGTIISNAGISTNDPTVESEGTVTITVKSSENLGSYKVSISENSGLTFQGVSAPSGVTADITGQTVTGITASGTTTLATYTFKAPKVEKDTKYTVKFSATETADVNTNSVPASSAPATVTVKGTVKEQPKEEKKEEPKEEINEEPEQQPEENNTSENKNQQSKNTELSSITVNGKTYNNPNEDFTIPSVDAEVSDINVTAVAKDENAKITITGNTGLKEGKTNTIIVTVTNGDAVSKYYIRVPKSVKIEEEQPNIIEDPEEQIEEKEKTELGLKSLKIKGYELKPKFDPKVFSYTIEVDMDKKDVNKLNIEAVANDDKMKVEILGNEKLVEGENIVSITVTSEDGEQILTYQIKVNKIIKSTEIVGKTEEKGMKEETTNTQENDNLPIIIAIASAVAAILGIIFAVIEYRYTKEDENEFGEGNIFDFEREMDIENKEENMGYVEELYKSQNIVEDYDDIEIEEPKKKTKSKGKHF